MEGATDVVEPPQSEEVHPWVPSAHDLTAMLDHLPALVAHWDNDLCNRFVNRASLDWFGIPPEKMYGQHIKEMLGQEAFEQRLPNLQRALAGERQVFQRTLVDVHGDTRHVEVSFTPHLVEGKVDGFFALVIDITERVEAERALRQSSNELAVILDREQIAHRMNGVVTRDLFAAALELSAALQPSVVDPSDRIRRAIAHIEAAISGLRSSVYAVEREVP